MHKNRSVHLPPGTQQRRRLVAGRTVYAAHCTRLFKYLTMRGIA
jgi:hypothetical protein